MNKPFEQLGTLFSTTRKKEGVQETMTKKDGTHTFDKNAPSIPLHIVGFGQGGGNIADRFAKIQTTEGKRAYTTYAVNTNKSDLTTLDSIPTNNRIWFGKDDFGNDYTGFGKNAERGTQRLQMDKNAQNVLHKLINESLGEEDEPTTSLFIACEGGGTGTSVLNEAVKMFYKKYREPLVNATKDTALKLQEAEKRFVEAYGKDQGAQLFEQQKNQVLAELNRKIENAIKKKRLIILITLPRRTDGADILRQVSNYTAELWNMTMDKKFNIGHLVVVDNQHLEDEYNSLDELKRKEVTLWDYINEKTVSIIHEINVGAGIGDTRDVLDAEDLKSLWFENQGAMFYAKASRPISEVVGNDDVVDLFTGIFKKSYLHGPFTYTENKDNSEAEKTAAKMIHHTLVFAVVPDKEKYDGRIFLPKVTEKLQNELYTSRQTRTFTGFIEDKNATDVKVYVAYKVEGLPDRLEVGLVKEYEEFEKRRQSVTFSAGSIQKIGGNSTESLLGDLADLINTPATGNTPMGIDVDAFLTTQPKKEENTAPTEQDLKALMGDFEIKL